MAYLAIRSEVVIFTYKIPKLTGIYRLREIRFLQKDFIFSLTQNVCKEDLLCQKAKKFINSGKVAGQATLLSELIDYQEASVVSRTLIDKKKSAL
jgi:hypothetical protein